MARRTYVPSLLLLAVALCRMIARATPVITLLYPTNSALLASLAAANAACGELSAQLALVREYGD
jgi:hypothetical protein